MNRRLIIAIVLIVLGVAASAYQGIAYTTWAQLIDIGPSRMTVQKSETIPRLPILGFVALAGGIAMMVVCGMRRVLVQVNKQI